MIEVALLLSVIAVYAYSYARIPVDPDWAMFNLWGFTGSKYGKDFVDCKSPAIHLWYLSISKVVGRSVERVRFMHTVLVSLPAFVILAVADNPVVALAYVVLINSGWLLAFHGNVGQQPAALIALAIVSGNEWLSAGMIILAVAFEPKLAPSAVAMFIIGGWWFPALAYGLALAVLFAGVFFAKRDVWDWLVEANITIPGRMHQLRRQYASNSWVPWYTAKPLLYILPWAWVAWQSGESVLSMFWLPAAIFLAVTFYGIAVRPNHLIPLIGWFVGIMALGHPPIGAVVALIAVDWISGGFYLGDIWLRFYHGLRDLNVGAKAVGEWLADRPGSLWVADLHSAVYVYSGKPVRYGMAEQIEIREVAEERRRNMLNEMVKDPPEYIVTGTSHAPNVPILVGGYEKIADGGAFDILKAKPGAVVQKTGG